MSNVACPEKLDKVDDLLVEYEGREELLIDNLTRMLTERGQAQPILHYMSLNTLNEEGTLSSSEQSLMSSSNSDGKLVDNVAYRAGVEALVKEGESAVLCSLVGLYSIVRPLFSNFSTTGFDKCSLS